MFVFYPNKSVGRILFFLLQLERDIYTPNHSTKMTDALSTIAPALVDQPGYWGAITSSIDWCEPNYVVSYYVAEWWNTISNVPFVMMPLFGLYCSIKYGYEKRIMAICIMTAIIGIGSGLFHGTLLFYCQLGDELPMLWGCLVCLYSLIEDGPKIRYPKLPYLIAAFGIAWSLASPWTHLYYPLCFQVLFISLEAICCSLVLKKVHACKNKFAKRVFYFGFCLFFFLGASSWLLDHAICSTAKSTQNPLHSYLVYRLFGSLHGYWHLFMAVHCYSAVLFMTFLRADILGRKPEICWKNSLLPFVIPTDKRP